MIKLTIPKEIEETEEIKKWKSETEDKLSKEMKRIFDSKEYKDLFEEIVLETLKFGRSEILAKFVNGEIKLEVLNEEIQSKD